MDIKLFIALMVVVYVVPELFKWLRKRKPNQYPGFPVPTPPSDQYPTAPGIPGELSRGMKPPAMPLYFMQEEGTPGDEGDPNWEIKRVAQVTEIGEAETEAKSAWGVDVTQATQGVVWATIIGPPVALRPMRQNRGRY